MGWSILTLVMIMQVREIYQTNKLLCVVIHFWYRSLNLDFSQINDTIMFIHGKLFPT